MTVALTRVFSMDVLNTPGAPDIQNLDICAAVGPNAALVRTVSGVTVSNGVLSIQSVYGSADDPELAAIEVVPSGQSQQGTPPTVTTKPATRLPSGSRMSFSIVPIRSAASGALR